MATLWGSFFLPCHTYVYIYIYIYVYVYQNYFGLCGLCWPYAFGASGARHVLAQPRRAAALHRLRKGARRGSDEPSLKGDDPLDKGLTIWILGKF